MHALDHPIIPYYSTYYRGYVSTLSNGGTVGKLGIGVML